MADLDAFDRFEAAGWETTAAAYDHYWPRLTNRLNDHLLDAVGVRPAGGPSDQHAGRAEHAGGAVCGAVGGFGDRQGSELRGVGFDAVRPAETGALHRVDQTDDVEFAFAGQLAFGPGVLQEVLVHQRAVVELDSGDSGRGQVDQVLGLAAAVVEVPDVDQQAGVRGMGAAQQIDGDAVLASADQGNDSRATSSPRSASRSALTRKDCAA